MPNRRPAWRDIAFPLIVGLFSLATVMRRPIRNTLLTRLRGMEQALTA
jgi:hypothetical protein